MKNLYTYLKGTKEKITPKDFKESIFNMCDTYLKSKTLTPEKMSKIARLRAYIEINLKDF